MNLNWLTKFAMQAIESCCAFAQVAVEKRQTDPAIVTRIRVARAGQAIINFRIVLGHVNREVLVRLVIHH